MKQKEVWKNVAGFVGLYTVSNYGNVKTLRRKVYRKDGRLHYTQREKYMKIKTLSVGNTGYYVLGLRRQSKTKLYFIHRLVAIAFIINKLNKPFINHKNGIKTDNYVENLEWCTKSENEKHAYKYLGKKSYFAGLFGKKHPNSKPILQLSKEGKLIKKWECAYQAKREKGFCPTCIGLCVSGRLKTHRGFKWSYHA